MFSSHKMCAFSLLAITLMAGGCAATSATGHARVTYPSPTLARLGAGDELGEAIFNHYVAMVRAGETGSTLRQAAVQPLAEPRLSTSTAETPTPTAEPWVMIVHVPGWVLHLGGIGAESRLIVLPAPPQVLPRQQLLAG